MQKNEEGEDQKSAVHEVFSASGKFFIIFIGSVVIGTMTAMIVAFIVKRQSSYETGNKRE